MSFVRTRYAQSKVEDDLHEAEVGDENTITMRIDVVPIPTESHKSNINLLARQNEVIRAINKKGQDLFINNRTVLSRTAGKNFYQTADLYGQRLAVEDMIPMLTGANLTLRVNAVRSGFQSQSSCFELKTGVLATMLNDTADSKSEKVAEVSVKGVSDNGKIFVGVKQERDGKHYIQKLDYEIDSIADDRFHLK